MSLRHRNSHLPGALLLVSLASTLLLGGCSSSSSSDDDEETAPLPSPLVIDTAGGEVVGATVFLVPASEVEALAASEITAANILDGSAEGFDEPLEDLIDGVASSAFPQGVTGPDGSFTLDTNELPNDEPYFLFVLPADGDTRHLEGGRLVLPETHACLQQFSADFPDGEIRPRRALRADFLLCLFETEDRRGHIELSTRPSSQSTYVGSSTCQVCHGTQFALHAKSLHRLSLQVPGQPAVGMSLQDEPLTWQDLSEFGTAAGDPEGSQYFDKALERFVDGTTICYSEYDGTRSFDKFKTLESSIGCDENAGDVASVRVWCENADEAELKCVRDLENELIRTAKDTYKVQINNLVNSADPLSGRIYTVSLTYGGGLYKQHYLTRIDGMESTYILPLQFQHEGDDASADRSRTVWSDYHLDLWSNVDPADPVAFVPASFMLQEPDVTQSFDIQCAGCHFTGYRVENTAAGEWTAQAVADPNGPIDFNGDGRTEEINIGCEHCHGPGSDHVAAGGEGIAIVSPPNLSPARANLICGQCHDRRGNGAAVTGDAPLNENNEPAQPGLSRHAFLAEFATVRKGPRLDADAFLPSIDSDFWPDDLHSKSHYQQYADFIKSSLYRNGSWLLVCVDCHNPHGPEGDIRHQLLLSIDDDSLCSSCHEEALGDLPVITDANKGAHTQEFTGFNHVGGNQQGQGPGGQPGPGQGNQGQREVPSCADCHMHQIAKSGAGRPGKLFQEGGDGGGAGGGGDGGAGGGDGGAGGGGDGGAGGGDGGAGGGDGGAGGGDGGAGGGDGGAGGGDGGAGGGDGGAGGGDGGAGGGDGGAGGGDGGAGGGDGGAGGGDGGAGGGDGGAGGGDGGAGGGDGGAGGGDGGAGGGDGGAGGGDGGAGGGDGSGTGDGGTGGGTGTGDGGTGGGTGTGDGGTGGGTGTGDGGTGGGTGTGDGGTGGGAGPGDGTGDVGSVGLREGQLLALANGGGAGNGGAGNGGAGDEQQFYENDISAHDFSIPRINKEGAEDVEGVFRDCGLLSMPIPYTRSCGRCHDLNKIENLLPDGELCE